jgi:hypothetical protein
MKMLYIFAVCLALAATNVGKTESEETEYFAVFLEGKKVGHAIQSRVVVDNKVTTTENVSITVSRGSIPITINVTETSIESPKGEPLGFELTQELSGIPMKVTGTVDKQGTMNLTSTAMGAEQKSTLQWPSGAVMAEGLRLLTLRMGLKEGTEYSAKIFSPGILQALGVKIRIGPKQNVDLLGRVVPLTEVETVLSMPSSGEIITTSYVDDELITKKTIAPIAGMVVEMVACAREFALGENDVFEVIDKMFLSAPEPLDDIQSAKSISYLLKPSSPETNLLIPADDNQRVRKLEDGSVIVVVEPVAEEKAATFPYKGDDVSVLEATKSTRFLQSDRKEIIELAHRAVGQTKDAAEAAKKIEAFVAEYIEQRNLSVGYASAAEVVISKQGDCSEFAVLTAAMCRALGIPAQVVVGVAYVSDFAGFEGFGGHAWTQAYVGDKWVGLDAAFKSAGLGGYDAGHIALAFGNGEPADFFNMASMLGQFKIEKVNVSKAQK